MYTALTVITEFLKQQGKLAPEDIMELNKFVHEGTEKDVRTWLMMPVSDIRRHCIKHQEEKQQYAGANAHRMPRVAGS